MRRSLNNDALWYEVHVTISPAIAEGVSNYLFELGCAGCFELENKLVATFCEQNLPVDLRKKMRKYLSELLSLGFDVPQAAIKIQCVEKLDWNAVWRRHFKPIVISDQIAIKPTWENLTQPFKGCIIEIDPKQAFGTGDHATTRLALMFLETYFKPGQVVLDVGTGSGILAVTAGKLGASQVVALDVDPLAAECAKENFKLNRVQSNLILFAGELSALSNHCPSFDLILANINKTVILTWMEELQLRLSSSGYLIISGILQEEREALLKAGEKNHGLTLLDERIQDGWASLVFRGKSKNESSGSH